MLMLAICPHMSRADFWFQHKGRKLLLLRKSLVSKNLSVHYGLVKKIYVCISFRVIFPKVSILSVLPIISTSEDISLKSIPALWGLLQK